MIHIEVGRQNIVSNLLDISNTLRCLILYICTSRLKLSLLQYLNTELLTSFTM